ncbi:unnamed protein product [Cladocopium goreaui]|uniref:C3H1-type domain-containing protein n=1 Tax=Cladocopium goreaui TaxID=2562237 RepID=A0A9P1DEN2_9DINO|nr:unnamed protein product [Cladocopium goreaui]
MVTRTACEVAVRSQPNPFSWAEIEHEPKVQRCCIGRSFRSTEYEILHTGGFVRLCTERGRVYWLAQNENDHRLPDWKIHFSVHLADIPRAWNILTDLFLKEACDFGMKAVAGEAFDSWPPEQRGREITVYIFQNHTAYNGGGPMMGYCPGNEHNFWLGPEFERQADFWAKFVEEAERLLSAANIQSRGVATGDLKLGRYASLRNEAFIFEPATGLYIYPPNKCGWQPPEASQQSLRIRECCGAWKPCALATEGPPRDGMATRPTSIEMCDLLQAAALGHTRPALCTGP